MTAIEQLLTVVSRYSAATGLSEATVSARYFGGGLVISKLRDGADMRSRRLEMGLARLSAHWPADAPWPADVPRPSAPQAAAE